MKHNNNSKHLSVSNTHSKENYLKNSRKDSNNEIPKTNYQKITPTIKKLRSAVRKTIDELKITSNDTILLAVSGGADSMALALATKHVTDKLQIPVHTVTVNHNIREKSREEAEHVQQVLLNIGYKNVHIADLNMHEVETHNSLGPEGNARLGRYELIRKLASKIEQSASKNKRNSHESPQRKCYVFTAHTMNDQAETVLLRIARGSGIKSLSAIAQYTYSFGLHLVRPLLDITREETENCCKDHNVSYVIDETNYLDSSWKTSNGSPLLRVAIRHKIIPLLNDALQQDSIKALSRTAILSQKDDEALSFITDEYFEKILIGEQPNEVDTTQIPSKDSLTLTLDVKQLRKLPETIRTRLYLKALKIQKYPLSNISSKNLLSIDHLVMKSDNKSYVELVSKTKVSIETAGLLIPFYNS